jgi:hypothetical protein
VPRIRHHSLLLRQQRREILHHLQPSLHEVIPHEWESERRVREKEREEVIVKETETRDRSLVWQ